MTIEGELVVRLERGDGRVRRVTVRSSRPQAASRIALGRTPAEAAAVIPSLFAICAHAQGAASALAIEAAIGTAPRPARMAVRERSVQLETVQEYLWRVLVDWPRAQRQTAATEPLAEARRIIARELEWIAPLARRIDGDMANVDAAKGTSAEFVTNAPKAADGADTTTAGVATIGAATAARLNAIAAQHVFGMPAARWLQRPDQHAVAHWAYHGATLPARLLTELLVTSPTLGRSDIAPMPLIEEGTLRASIVPAMRSQREFASTPTWDGAPVETGALARTQAHPIVASFLAAFGNAVTTRMVARLTELAELLGRLGAESTSRADEAERGAASAVPRRAGFAGERVRAAGNRDQAAMHWVDGYVLDEGEGLAAVQTARGLLLHRVRVTGGRAGNGGAQNLRVAEYQIVAPTEWNFHPDGALVKGLEGIPAADEATLERDARLLVQALDPCVACRVEIAYA